MQVDELLKPFPIKEFHPFPRALMVSCICCGVESLYSSQ